jgi:polysaccharide deacetylase family protein (PEP-CTERM system associated)
MLNALSVDVEEYFHPTELHTSSHQWDSLPSRIEQQVFQVLELFDKRGVKATFFILGWIAEKHPGVVRTILSAGHEIGCHSYAHELVYRQTPAEFRRDTERAVDCIASACGSRPRAYRAPSYSIVLESFWALEILVECGFTHDSSIYPIAHDRYGVPGFSRHAKVLHTPAGPILEVPIATVKLSEERIAPIGGGGYLRLLPYSYTSAGMRAVNRKERKPACIYFHPWEIDPDQPRLAAGRVSRLRTYMGLKGMYRKLDRLLTDFEFSTLTAVYGDIDSPPLPPRRQTARQTLAILK